MNSKKAFEVPSVTSFRREELDLPVVLTAAKPSGEIKY